MDQRKHLIQLREDWSDCKKCDLHKYRDGTRIVFGAGSASARYLFLYDTPTAEDMDLASPMSGDYGSLLVDLMKQAGVSSTESYCTPLVGCRPFTVIPETEDAPEKVVDRTPDKAEYTACSPRVQELIYTVNPRLIFAMGDVPWKYLIRTKDRGAYTNSEKARGLIFVHRRTGVYHHEVQYPVIPILSMKQIMANPSASSVGPLTVTIRDLIRGRKYVETAKRYEEHDEKQIGS